MNLTEMWQRFQELSPSFISRYVAYHNFRSKGWVVKTGIKYGADFGNTVFSSFRKVFLMFKTVVFPIHVSHYNICFAIIADL